MSERIDDFIFFFRQRFAWLLSNSKSKSELKYRTPVLRLSSPETLMDALEQRDIIF